MSFSAARLFLLLWTRAPALDQHVEDFALGVDGAPQIDHAAIDFQIDFVQMPSRVGLITTSTSE